MKTIVSKASLAISRWWADQSRHAKFKTTTSPWDMVVLKELIFSLARGDSANGLTAAGGTFSSDVLPIYLARKSQVRYLLEVHEEDFTNLVSLVKDEINDVALTLGCSVTDIKTNIMSHIQCVYFVE